MSRLWRLLPLAAGIAGLVWLGLSIDGETWRAALAIPPLAVVAVLAAHVPVFLADGIALDRLIRPNARLGAAAASIVALASQSVGRMLPTSQIGGEAAKVRLLMLHRVPALDAVAVVLADIAVGAVTLIAFAMMGLIALAAIAPETGWWGVPTAAVAGVGVLTGFPAAIRAQLGSRLARALRLPRVARRLRGVELTLWRILRDRRRCAAALAWRLAGWALGAIEVWAGLRMLGHPVGVADAVIVECVVQAVRAAAFMLPGALGVQEGGILLIASLLGIPAPAALGFALLRRVREVVVSLLGLAAWHREERRAARPGARKR